ncbi:hypothetical protein CEE37_04335 [candidate division LCP-89 bacterium B3_LCP]|uniref:Uncharacterized protein n=1 Tax=candidate division LCP-89 bacterium B3_LCP TaxID=2012998 RepID=A0A532V3V9_UNCL8|nr:MAG: hypothetical protein CEE37_04335 [candidate division LCP-89 bacterium B3_LCP]
MSNEKKCQCPAIEDENWHLQDLNWSGKYFYFAYLNHFFGIPLSIEKVKEKLFTEINQKEYTTVYPSMILHLPGLFQGRLLVEIEDPGQYDANVELFEEVRILTRVHRGPKKNLKRSVDEIKAFAQDRAHILPGKIYFWYATCQICAPESSLEKTVLFARI